MLLVVGAGFFSDANAADISDVKKSYPRLGGVYNGRSPYTGYEDPEYHESLARLDLVVLGFPRGWRRDGVTPRDIARSIKRLNPDILLGQYTILGQVSKKSNAAAPLRDKISSESGPNDSNAFDWYARDRDGNQTSVYANTWYVNLTEYTRPDRSGNRWPEHYAQANYDEWFNAPEWDLWYADSTFVQPRASREGGQVDWSGGKVKDNEEINAAYRRGHAAYWSKIGDLRPDIFVMPNLGGWVKRKDSHIVLPEYYQKVAAGQFEGLMGRSWSNESLPGGWYRIMDEFRLAMSYLRDPKLLLFNVSGDPQDYQFFRYAFASSLMDDGYFSFRTNDQYGHGFVAWFDEYDLAGRSNTAWLGRALSPPQRSSWKKGVYRRDFENGIVLVNPRENGAQTVTIEDGFSRIDGRQDPRVNNGEPVTSVTLKDRDGIVLVRTGNTVSVADPKSPSIVVQ